MTGVIGLVILLSMIIYGGRWGVTFLALLGCFGALFEYFTMLFALREGALQKIVSIAAGYALSVLIIFRSDFLYEGISIVFILYFLFYLSLSTLYAGNHQKLFSDLAGSLVGIFYVGFLFSFWPKIRELPLGVYWIFLIFLIPWVSDTAAYFIGRSLGKHPLAPAISPKKTVEGALGGIIFAVIGVILYKSFFFKALTLTDCVLLGGLGSIIGQLGDLFESFLKRAFGVKDSGVVIPGHGGILDRFDSVLFSAPLIYFYALIS